MGISGLLVALKTIQVTKPLSEFSGQTVAVDAYVWLHKAVYSCATELATGQATSKYVTYAMDRVRILRHHGIEPYIVFDGGPLRAKQGTENERKQRREDHVARGNMFAAQGRHNQARECYTKAVDVTPQMAFQLIKALRAEGVKYIVAPYEADAQLAFLEKEGIVSAILTEDSDLLVFGCKNVLFKLDTNARTVVSIAKKDFTSVSPSADSSSISLVGWSEKQFREMAILSGCDYLPSIPGVGLKTACGMLRRWKTPEQVVRSIMLEGKKSVPKGYLQQFRLAEKCFLYQRVYHPKLEQLVHLNEIPNEEEWDEIADSYVGRDLDPTLAKAVALGDKDPVSYSAMEDINPGFVPRTRVLQDLPLPGKPINRSLKGKGKTRDTVASEGILSFFGPNPKIPQMPKSPTKTKVVTGSKSKMVVGKQSGKRTLADIHDQDSQSKKQKRTTSTKPAFTRSKFFGSSEDHTQVTGSTFTPTPGSPCLADKENEYITIDDIDEEEAFEEAEDGDSMVGQGRGSSDAQDLEDEGDHEVEQEDGYISPTPSRSRDTPELSSPPRPRTAPQLGRESPDGLDFGAEPVSSPPSGARSYRRTPVRHTTPPIGNFAGNVLIEASPEPEAEPSGTRVDALDLRNSFGDDFTGTEFSEDEPTPTPLSFSPSPPDLDRDPSPLAAGEELDDPEEQEEQAVASRSAAVAAGWRNMWSLDPSRGQPSSASLRRSGTNVTPTGRHRLADPSKAHPYLYSYARSPNTAPSKSSSSDIPTGKGLRGRRSLVFVETKTTKTELNSESSVESLTSMSGRTSAMRPRDAEPDVLTRAHLEKFRLFTR
ncbi:hypothetical protein V5O48_006750 [Marasmius crinis-equi]|uniref:Exonuclease 1 n=1 Tax=Marasmius crinis-equi TaxID=585013 RepID=A0ABR3FIK2_9AGAR